MPHRGLAAKELLFASFWVGQGKLIPILVQKGTGSPKHSLGFSPKDVCHMSVCEVPRLSPTCLMREHVIL